MSETDIQSLRKQAFDLSCHDQFRLASFIAENVGYVLTPEKFDEQEALQSARDVLMQELDDIFDNAKQISCTRLSLAIEVLIDAKLKRS